MFIKGAEKFCFNIIPGREYNMEMKGHILGLGSKINPSERDPQSVINAITDAGGLAVICHPDSPAFYFSHELLLKLKGYIGIEENQRGSYR